MIYKESETVELKEELTTDVKKEIVAFLNSKKGGAIYVGVKNDGSIIEMDDDKKDRYISIITNWINDNAISPIINDYINVSLNEDGVIEIKVSSGERKPYFLKNKGMTSNGCFKRVGRSKYPMNEDEIQLMGLECQKIYYESRVSRNQNLSFVRFFDYLSMNKISFDESKFYTLGFKDKNGMFTNLAQLFSDQNSIIIKLAVYRGLDRTEFKIKKEFEGAFTSIINTLLDYCNTMNDVRAIKPENGWVRTDIYSYPKKAIREAVLNSIEHANFYFNSNIKIEFFDDRLEISNPGPFYGGITLEQALNGKQSFRNPKLVYVLNKLGYIENYATGLQTIYKLYRNHNVSPIVESSETHFTIILPNKNYKYNKNANKKVDQSKKVDHSTGSRVDQKVDQSNKVDQSKKVDHSTELHVDQKVNQSNKVDQLKGMDNCELNYTQLKLMEVIMIEPKISIIQLSEELLISVQAVKKNIKILKEKKIIERIGNNRVGYWKIKK